MADKEKFVPKVLQFKGVRMAFERVYDAQARKNKDGTLKMRKNKATGLMEPDLEFSCTVLLDPSNKDHAAQIAAIKEESVRALNHRYGPAKFSVSMLDEFATGKRALNKFHLPWGYGNSLPEFGAKIYEGFADRFFLKLKDKDYNRPHLLNRNGKPTLKGEPQALYGGCIIAGTTTLYSYDNESRGLGANLRTLVYVDAGEAFGGGRVDASTEYEALGLGEGAEPFEESAGGKDPFDIG